MTIAAMGAAAKEGDQFKPSDVARHVIPALSDNEGNQHHPKPIITAPPSGYAGKNHIADLLRMAAFQPIVPESAADSLSQALKKRAELVYRTNELLLGFRDILIPAGMDGSMVGERDLVARQLSLLQDAIKAERQQTTESLKRLKQAPSAAAKENLAQGKEELKIIEEIATTVQKALEGTRSSMVVFENNSFRDAPHLSRLAMVPQSPRTR